MAGAVPSIVVLALGAGALGGPDALRLLVELAGRSPVVDIGICHFVYSMLATQLFGTALLVRFVRKAPGAGRGAAAADPFAQVTLLLSLAAAFLVAACLAVASGGPYSVCIPVDLAAEYYYPVAIVVAAAAGAALSYAMPLLRTFCERRNERGAGPAERATTTRRTARLAGLLLVAAVAVAVAIPFAARGGLDVPRLRFPPGFTNMPVAVAVAVATVVGATLLVCFSRRARNATAGATRAPATAPRTRGASAT